MMSETNFFEAQMAVTHANLKVAQAQHNLAQAEQAVAAANLARFTQNSSPSFFSTTQQFAYPQQKMFQNLAPAPAQQQQQQCAEPLPLPVAFQEPEQQVEQQQQVPEPVQQVPDQVQQQQQQVPQRIRGKYLNAAANAPEVAPEQPATPIAAPAPGTIPIAKVRSNAPPSVNAKPKQQVDATVEKKAPAAFMHYCAKTIKDSLGDNIFSPNKRYTFAEVRRAGYCTAVRRIEQNGPLVFICREPHTHNRIGNCQEHFDDYEKNNAGGQQPAPRGRQN